MVSSAAWSPEEARLYARAEDAGINASAPPQQLWLDGWLLRFSPGKAQRARCINAVALGRQDFDAKLAQAQSVYAQAALPLIFRITPFTEPHNLDQRLAERDYRVDSRSWVMVARNLDDRLRQTQPRELPPNVVMQSMGAAAFAQAVGQLRGSPLAQRQAHAQRLELSPVPFSAYVLRDVEQGQVIACGQVAIQGDMVGVYDVYTLESERGRGHAGALCDLMLRQALTASADKPAVKHGYLQVDIENDAARHLYRQLGFEDAFTYHYRTKQALAHP